MTTETAPDPVVRQWSDELEQELAEAGMEDPQAKVFARAFELGMNRVLSVLATKEELLQTKLDLQREIDNLRNELRREMEIRFAEFDKRLKMLAWGMAAGFGMMTGLLSAIIAIVA